MTFLPAFQISSSGLTAERIRMDLTSSNLANVQTTRGPDGEPYRKLRPIFNSKPLGDDFEGSLQSELGSNLQAVEYGGAYKDPQPPKRVFDPGHPDADKDGYVSLPNINVMEEVADMLLATRAYEANVTAFNTTKSMAVNALDLGKS